MKKTLLVGLLILGAISLNAQGTEIYQSKDSIKGAFKTFNEFIRNKPSIVDPFYVKSKERNHEDWKGTYSLTPKYTETDRRIKKIWGFYDGTTAYILHQSEFFPIVFEDGQYVFIGFDIVDNSSVSTAGLLGGAIGSGIASAVALSNAKSNKTKYTIDKNTGKPVHPQRSTEPLQIAEKKISVNIYRKGRKELDLPFEFTVNDSLRYAFIPNSFVNLKFDEQTTSLKINYGDNLSESVTITLNKDKDKYIQCSLLEKDKIPQVVVVTTSTGEFDSQKPEKEQKKRESNKL